MISVKNLYFSYTKEKYTIEDCSFEVNNNEILAIIGANGSGKSTLISLLAGLRFSKFGTIKIDDLVVSKNSDYFTLRKTIGVTFQDPTNQIIFDKVEDDLSFTLTNLNFDKTLHQSLISQALTKVNMLDYIESNPFELSLGQKQRVAIASAILTKPKVLILDEPTTMLDPTYKQEIIKLIKQQKSIGNTIIFSTNNIDEILIADKVLMLNEGRVANCLTPNEIIDNLDLLSQIDLKPTYRIKLLNYVRNNDVSLSDVIDFIEGDK